jgi:hypothetical protein
MELVEDREAIALAPHGFPFHHRLDAGRAATASLMRGYLSVQSKPFRVKRRSTLPTRLRAIRR